MATRERISTSKGSFTVTAMSREHTERTQPEKKLSIRERLENARQECVKQKAPEIRKPGRDVPEHGDL